MNLAADYAHKVELMNQKRQNLLHEKQEAYNEQFAQDVDYFKKHGKPGSKYWYMNVLNNLSP